MNEDVYNWRPHWDYGVAVGMELVAGVRNYRAVGVLPEHPGSDAMLDLAPQATELAPEIALPVLVGEALEIVSDSPADTGTVSIEGLGPDGALVPTFTVDLNGETPVPLGILSRINGAASVGGAGFDGQLTIQNAGGTVFGVLREEDQQLNQALYTVPAGWRGHVGTLGVSMLKPSGTETGIALFIRVKAAGAIKWARPFPFGMQRSGASAVRFENVFPQSVPLGPFDIKISASASSAGASVAGFITGERLRAS